MPNGQSRQVFGGQLANCAHSKYSTFRHIVQSFKVLKYNLHKSMLMQKKSHFWIPREISGKKRKKRVARQYGMMNNLSPKWWRGYQVSNMLWIMLDRVLVYWWNSIELHQWSVIFSTHWVIVKWNISYECIHFSAKVFHDVSSYVKSSKTIHVKWQKQDKIYMLNLVKNQENFACSLFLTYRL